MYYRTLTNVLWSYDVIGHVTEQNVCEKHVLERNIRVVLLITVVFVVNC